MTNLIKSFFAIPLIYLAFFITNESLLYTRDRARIINAHTLHKTIEYYLELYDNYPTSNYNNNISLELFDEGLINYIVRDPVFLTPLNKPIIAYNTLVNIFSQFFTYKSFSNFYDDLTTTLTNPVRMLYTFPLECVLVYTNDDLTQTFEISTFLESRFNKIKMKNDGGNDSTRYETGTNYNLNTSIYIQENKVVSSFINAAIIK